MTAAACGTGPETTRYEESIRKIREETGAGRDEAVAMILLTATLMDLCPWDEKVCEMLIADCRRQRHVDLCEPEPCAEG